MPLIPAFHQSTFSKAIGNGTVSIPNRKSPPITGEFSIKIDVKFDPAVDLYPTGNVFIKASLTDSAETDFKSTEIQMVNSFGKHSPTIVLTGRCESPNKDLKGLHFWLLIASNGKDGNSPDVVSFVVQDNRGQRVAYGTGALVKGNIEVAPN